MVRLGTAFVRFVKRSVRRFPRTFSEITVVFGTTFPDPPGYNAEDAIYEVLEDVGLLWDPESFSASRSQDRSTDVYVVTFTLDDP
jgi:hypothetical protein